jgi:hypothetical protein
MAKYLRGFTLGWTAPGGGYHVFTIWAEEPTDAEFRDMKIDVLADAIRCGWTYPRWWQWWRWRDRRMAADVLQDAMRQAGFR